MVIKRVGPLSFAKIVGASYALMGFIFGGIISLVSVVGGGFMPRESGTFGLMFGLGAVVLLPLFYGILGFIMSLIGAAVYNLLASWIGGVEIDVQ